MRCPFCSHNDAKVVDSRSSKDGEAIRRRRECLHCGRRYTTYERIEKTPLVVVKKDGRREDFDRGKILEGVRIACQKRPISTETLESLVNRIEKHFQETEQKEISAVSIGELVVKELYSLDDVAYVRFASVYRDFKDVNQFMSELKHILKNKINK